MKCSVLFFYFLVLRSLTASLGLKEKPPSKLEEVTFAGIAEYLASDQCKNVITMAGAGISTCECISCKVKELRELH